MSPAQLLDVGGAMFAERPYQDVQMEHVAERAGVSRALLYRHFPTKQTLDYFAANRNMVLAANRTLAGDPGVQAIIAADRLGLQRVLLDAVGADAGTRETVAAVLLGWLQLVHSVID